MPQVGDAWIEVHADGSSLYREVRDAAERAAAGAKIKLNVELDTKGLVAKVKAAGIRASKSAKVTFRTDLDAKGLAAKVRAASKLAGGSKVKVQTELDRSSLAKTVTGPRVQFLTDFEAVQSGARRALLTARRTLVNQPPIQLPVQAQLQTGAVIAQTAALRAFFKANPIQMPVRLQGLARPQTALLQATNGLRNRVSSLGAGIGQSLAKVVAPIGVVAKFAAAQVTLLVTAVAAALPFIKALGVGLAGLAVDLGTAALSAGGFVAAGIVAIGAAAVTTAIGVSHLRDTFGALGKIWDAQNQGLKVSKKDWAAFQTQMKQLAPSAQQFVTSLNNIHPAWRVLTKDVQQSLFEGVGKSLQQTATTVLPLLKSGLTGIAGVINDMALGFLKWTRSTEGMAAINAVFSESKIILKDLGSSAGNLGQGLITLFTGGRKNAIGLSKSLVGLTQNFQNWASKFTTIGAGGTTPLEDFLVKARVNLGKVKSLLGSTGSLVSSFWANWSGAGQVRPDILSDLQGQVEKWADFFRNPANQGAIKAFITKTASDFNELKEAALNTAGAINLFSKGLEIARDATPIAQLIRQLTEGTSAFDELANKGAQIQLDKIFAGLDISIQANKVKLNQESVDKAKADAARQAREAAEQVRRSFLEQQSIDIELESKLHIKTPTKSDILKATARALAQGKRKFTLPGGQKFTIDANGKAKLVFTPPTKNEIQVAANKALAKGKQSFKIKGKTYDIDSEGIPHLRIKKKPKVDHKQFLSLKQAAEEALGGLTSFGFTVDVDPTIRITPAQVTADRSKIDKAIQEALKTGKNQEVKIGGKKFTVSVHGKVVSIDPVKETPKPKGKVGVDGKITHVDPPKKPTPFPVQPVIDPHNEPDFSDLPAVELPVVPVLVTGGEGPNWFGGTSPSTLPPVTVPLIPETSGFSDVGPKLTGAIGNITVPIGYKVAPTPPMPSPTITVPIGFRQGPFPKLPSPTITVPIHYKKDPLNLPQPGPIHVRVVYDYPGAARGKVVLDPGSFTPDAARGTFITRGPQLYNIGEKGPEAVVPLGRNGALDPDVRALLQAVAFSRGMGGNGDVEPTVVQHIMLPTGDPLAAAMAVANRLALVRTV